MADEQKISVELTPTQAGEIAVAAHGEAATAFAASNFLRAARYYEAAAELCRAIGESQP